MVYRLTNAAEEDLFNIYVEGCRQFGPAQAEAYIQKLKDTFDLLSDFPMLARKRDELAPPVRIHGCGAHIIIYDVDAMDDILVIRIRHGREDWLKQPTPDT